MLARFKLFWTFAIWGFIVIFLTQYMILRFAVPLVRFTATVLKERDFISKGPKCEVTLSTLKGETVLIFYQGICSKTYKAGEMVAFKARILRFTGSIEVDPKSVEILLRTSN